MIITFYSFKGGVGRSMAMANIGTWLYRQGQRVLLVDWDLEAPGLESFFVHKEEELQAIKEKPGLVDLIESYRHLWQHSREATKGEVTGNEKAKRFIEQIGSIQHLFIPIAGTGPSSITTREPGLWLFHAGCRAGETESLYTKTVSSLDWSGFYDEYGGHVFLEWLRRELNKNVDVVLIDSRTGLTEMGGVCMQHMADIAFCFLAPNDSNLNGVKKITEILLGDQVKNLRGAGRPIAVYPIPTRVDTQGESVQLKQFEDKFRKAFSKFSGVNVDWCWESKIRYITRYSYEEEVVFLSDSGHPDLRRVYERIGYQIARLYEENQSPANREDQARYKSSLGHQLAPVAAIEGVQRTVQQLINTARDKMAVGDFATSESLFFSALKLGESDLGREHPDTISAMKNLAATMYAQGNLAGARALQEQVLAVNRQVLGDEHPDTLTSMANLASTLSSQGDLTGARALDEKALAVRRRVLGEEHPNTLSSMSNLALTLSNQGDFTGARALQEKALAVRRRVLGEEHPDTLISMSNLASILSNQGDFTNARTLQEKALEVRRRVLGEEHPDTLTSMNNLATTLRDQSELTGARALQGKVLEVSRRVLGEEHPKTLSSMNNLASILWDQSELTGARALQEKTLAVRRRVLGEEHPDTLTSMSNLASTLSHQGDLTGARALQEKALEVARRVLGEEHPDTLTSMNNLATTLSKQHDFAGAHALQEKVLEVSRRQLGKEHPNTLTIMHNLADMLWRMEKYLPAQQLMQTTAEGRVRVLGPDHPDTLASERALKQMQVALG